jgi:hypothetical protein
MKLRIDVYGNPRFKVFMLHTSLFSFLNYNCRKVFFIKFFLKDDFFFFLNNKMIMTTFCPF